MYTERWVSESIDASNLSAWRRPFKRETNTLRLAQKPGNQVLPRGSVLTVGPVNYRGHHAWVVVTTPHDRTVPGVKFPPHVWSLWGVPFYRLAGICKINPVAVQFVRSFAVSLMRSLHGIRRPSQRGVHHVELRHRRGYRERTVAERCRQVV